MGEGVAVKDNNVNIQPTCNLLWAMKNLVQMERRILVGQQSSEKIRKPRNGPKLQWERIVFGTNVN